MRLLVLLLAGLACTATALAQNASRRGGFGFYVVTPGRVTPEGLKYAPATSGAAKPLVFHPSNLSAKYPYAGAQPIDFFREIPAPEDGAPTRELVASFSPESGIDEYILVFVSGKNAKDWKIEGIPVTPRTMAPAAISFYNGLGTSVRASIGRKESVLRPGLNAPQSVVGMTHNVVTITKREHDAATGKMVETSYEGFNEGVEVVLTSGVRKRPFYDRALMVAPSQSYMLLVFPPEDPKDSRYRIKTLSTVPPPPDPAARGR